MQSHQQQKQQQKRLSRTQPRQQRRWLSEARAVTWTGFAVAAFLLLLLGPSQDWQWPAPWLVGAAAAGLVLLPCFLYVRRFNPDLIEERERFTRNPGTAGFDKLLVPASVWLIAARFAAAGLQHRQQLQQPGWAPTPLLSTPQQQLALAGLVAACLLQTWAVCSNRNFSSVVRIQSDRGHQVCSRGPYAWVRHPGYVAFSLQGVAEAVLLQSCWAMYCAVAKLVLLLVRTVYEDAFLQSNLPGYAAYAQAVRYRWLPLVW